MGVWAFRSSIFFQIVSNTIVSCPPFLKITGPNIDQICQNIGIWHYKFTSVVPLLEALLRWICRVKYRFFSKSPFSKFWIHPRPGWRQPITDIRKRIMFIVIQQTELYPSSLQEGFIYLLFIKIYLYRVYIHISKDATCIFKICALSYIQYNIFLKYLIF